jgi:hypothetical protein
VFAALLQERRQAGAVAARAFHCPTATARHLAAGEAEQLLVAGRIGAGGGLGEHSTDRGECRGGQGVAVVSTPMTPSTVSASMVMRRFLLVRDGRGRRRPGRSHRAAQL